MLYSGISDHTIFDDDDADVSQEIAIETDRLCVLRGTSVLDGCSHRSTAVSVSRKKAKRTCARA
jgi:hypothetical protein